MTNFEELQNLHFKKEKLEKLIKATSTLILEKEYIIIYRSDNGRYTLSDVNRMIGEEKMNQLIQQFENLLLAELYQIRESNNQQLAVFSIIRKEELQ